jgi:16S rRNA (guanine966-N2)-methyltransferase
MVVVERSTRSPEPGWPAGFTGTRGRKYGETTLWYGHAAGERPGEPSDVPTDQPTDVPTDEEA